MSLPATLRRTAGLAAVVVALAACGATASPAPSQDDAEAAACSAIQTWADEMRTFAALDPATASIEDVAAQREAVADAWDAFKATLATVDSADKAAVETAGATLEAALTDIPTDAPIADVVGGITAAAAPLKAVYQEMADGLGCTLVAPF
jgi:hypothetical protein